MTRLPAALASCLLAFLLQPCCCPARHPGRPAGSESVPERHPPPRTHMWKYATRRAHNTMTREVWAKQPVECCGGFDLCVTIAEGCGTCAGIQPAQNMTGRATRTNG